MSRRLLPMYILLFVFVGCGVFSIWQFVLPLVQGMNAEEEPYAFTHIQEIVKLPDTESENSGYAQYDSEALLAMNDDYVGWLEIPDTTISFPIVQGSDNSFYLNHGFDKKYSYYGCPFLDTRTPPGGDNLVIHGHNMGNNRKEIFSPLLRFQNTGYAEQHKAAFFSICPSTIKTQYELFAVVNFNSNNELTYLFSEFEDAEHRDGFIQFLKKYSFYKTDYVPPKGILILSTCNRTYGEDNRLLLCFGELETAN